MTPSRFGMKQNKMAQAVLISTPLLYLATFSLWAEPELGDEATSTPAAEESTLIDADDPAEKAEVTGLDIALDGSSLEAFEKSLERVRETSSEADYNSVKAAFEFLLIYDIGAKNDRELLAKRLDGKTGREMLERIKWGNRK